MNEIVRRSFGDRSFGVRSFVRSFVRRSFVRSFVDSNERTDERTNESVEVSTNARGEGSGNAVALWLCGVCEDAG